MAGYEGGTPEYQPPELLINLKPNTHSHYDARAADHWANVVIVARLLYACYPWDGRPHDIPIKVVRNPPYMDTPRVFKERTRAAWEFIKKGLHRDP